MQRYMFIMDKSEQITYPFTRGKNKEMQDFNKENEMNSFLF